jgi:hypothetical protein
MIYYYQIRNHHYKTEPVPQVTCPLCNTTGGMSMSIQQKYVWMIGPMAPSARYAIAQCTHCENLIPKVKWTDEMDAAYQLLKRDITTPRRLYRGMIVLPLLLIAFIGAILFTISSSAGRQKNHAAAVKEGIRHPSPGSIFQVIHSAGGNSYYTYFKVARSDSDSLYLLPAHVQKTDMTDWDKVPTEAGAYEQQPLAVSISKTSSDDMFTYGSSNAPEYGIIYGIWKNGELIKKY